ncbi:histidine triad nucleotide-binding protein [Microbacterium nanhaiense]|uniref:Histidine triad nucleotide-binding protein n=2 Tax=Microbacterium nanhaiense TaxID=1301026 RepID=A0ABQ2N255_9MICO|nr:histidine triad nucleotide-binding protein [Microbacterium nanhaiense]
MSGEHSSGLNPPTTRLDSMSEPTVFTRILNGEIPGEIVAQTERVFAITDIAPQAPLHVLVIPKTEQYMNVAELAAGDPSLLAEVIEVANGVAAEKADGEFRLIFNTGAGAGQTVFHVHAHVLAGDLEEKSLVG